MYRMWPRSLRQDIRTFDRRTLKSHTMARPLSQPRSYNLWQLRKQRKLPVELAVQIHNTAAYPPAMRHVTPYYSRGLLPATDYKRERWPSVVLRDVRSFNCTRLRRTGMWEQQTLSRQVPVSSWKRTSAMSSPKKASWSWNKPATTWTKPSSTSSWNKSGSLAWKPTAKFTSPWPANVLREIRNLRHSRFQLRHVRGGSPWSGKFLREIRAFDKNRLRKMGPPLETVPVRINLGEAKTRTASIEQTKQTTVTVTTTTKIVEEERPVLTKDQIDKHPWWRPSERLQASNESRTA